MPSTRCRDMVRATAETAGTALITQARSTISDRSVARPPPEQQRGDHTEHGEGDRQALSQSSRYGVSDIPAEKQHRRPDKVDDDEDRGEDWECAHLYGGNVDWRRESIGVNEVWKSTRATGCGHGRQDDGSPTPPALFDTSCSGFRPGSSVLRAQLIDITTLAVDAIVNAANSELAPGGGVCGAIHDAAGPELEAACVPLAPCPAGEARITPGFRLPARFVIHAVGPRWWGGGFGEAEALAAVYANALRIANEHYLESVAFPAISTGIYGYPLESATAIAVTAVRNALAAGGSVSSVLFACFDIKTLQAYDSAGVSP